MLRLVRACIPSRILNVNSPTLAKRSNAGRNNVADAAIKLRQVVTRYWHYMIILSIRFPMVITNYLHFNVPSYEYSFVDELTFDK